MKDRKISELERLARLRADRELKKYAAFRAHVEAAQKVVSSARKAMEQSYRSTAPLTVSEARMANAQAGRSARDLRRAEMELQRMKPRFEQARLAAAREFGRAEALRDLAARAKVRDAGGSDGGS